MKYIYTCIDIFFLTLMTGGITGLFLNLNNFAIVKFCNVLILIFYILMIVRLLHLKNFRKNSYALIVSFLLIVYLVFDLTISQAPRTSLEVTLHVLLNIVYAYFLYNRYNSSEILSLLSTAIGIVVIGSFIVSIGLSNIGTYYDIVYSTDVWRGLFTHKNTLGNITAFYLLILFIDKKKWGIQKIGNTLVAITTLFYSTSHTPLYILIFCLLYLIIKKIIKKELSYFILIIIFGMNYLLICNYKIIKTIIEKLNFDGTLSGRDSIYVIILNLVEEKKYFGYGLKSSWENESIVYQTMYRHLGFNPNSSHNAFLELLLGVGFVGLLIFMVIIISIFILGVKNYGLMSTENGLLMLLIFLLFSSTYESTLATNIDQIYGVILFYIFFVVSKPKIAKST